MRYRRLAPIAFMAVLVLFAAYLALSGRANKPPDAQTHLKQGQAALDRGDTAKAVTELQAAISLDPKLVQARFLLAQAYDRAGERDKAANELLAVGALDPKDADIAYRSGALLVQMNRPLDAVAPLAAGVRLNKGMAISYTNEISAAVSAGLAAGRDLAAKNPSQGISLLQSLTALDEGNVKIYLLLGNTYIAGGRPAEAIQQYQKVLALDPKNASAMTNLGAAYYQMGKLDEAVAQLKTALKAGEDAETRYLLGAAYIQQNKLAEARAEFEAAIKLNIKLGAAYIGLGNVQLLENDMAGAEATLRKAIEIEPDSPEAHYALGKVLMEKGDKAGARQALTKFLTLNPPPNRRDEVNKLLQQLGP